MNKLTKKNVFCGATVNKGTEELVVYKVNSKTVYAGKLPYFDFLVKWDNRSGGITQKKLFKQIGAEQYRYEDLAITKSNADKKEKFDYINAHRQEQDTLLSLKERKTMRDVFERYLAGKPFRYPNHFGAKMAVAVMCNPNGFMLLRIEENWVFWDSELNLFFPFIKAEHKKGKDVIWPDKIFIEEVV